MRDYQKEFQKRVEFIKDVLKKSEASGIVFGNSGGKDSALVGILCKAACNDTDEDRAALMDGYSMA